MNIVAEGVVRVPEPRRAFTDWVTPSIPAMFRLIARLGPDLDRDDVLQDAMVRAVGEVTFHWEAFEVTSAPGQILVTDFADPGTESALRLAKHSEHPRQPRT